MRLILGRHGETESNRERLALGREDVPLNEKGRLQAAALAASLRGLPVAAVYSSPLVRALDTARAIAGLFGLEVQPDERLIEMDVGEMEGLTPKELRDHHGDFIRRWFTSEAAMLPMPGGESLQQVQDRAWAAVESLRESHPEETVVAVSHNFTIRAIACRALALPLAEFRRFRLDLGAKAALDVEPGRAVLVELNDTCHLRAEGLLEHPGYWSPPA
jgi:broad specificity phosphatase PhoE